MSGPVLEAWWIAISSIPMTRGPGVPARASCAFIYCISSALTVCQSSANSSQHQRSTPVGNGARQNTQSAWCRTDCLPESRAVPVSPCRSYGNRCAAPPARAIFACPCTTGRALAGSCGRTIPSGRGHSSHTMFFDRRFKVTMRTFGSPKTPRTSGSARNPSN